MNEIQLADKLRVQLDEVNFVYRELPAALERAGSLSTRDRWSAFFRDQAATLRTQQRTLLETATQWGRRLRPCVCTDVSDRLNEVRYAVTARQNRSAMEGVVHTVLTQLRAQVMKRLDEAAHLAARIGETDLATRLRELWGLEREQELAHEEPWREAPEPGKA